MTDVQVRIAENNLLRADATVFLCAWSFNPVASAPPASS
jgi:hypothetical protein